MKKLFIGSYLLIAITCIHAQRFEQLSKLIASDRAPGNGFGSAIALSGNYAVVAAADIPSLGVPANCNCVYVFEKTNGNWIQKQKLLPVNKISGDDFGHAVSISGNYIIVGAPNDENLAGAAYIFERNSSGNWAQVKKIVAPDRSAFDVFGTSVSISGNYAVVGAPGDGDYGTMPKVTGAGSAYFFTNLTGTWELLNKVGPVAGTYNDRSQSAAFGFSVAISGTSAVIGAPGEKKDTTGSNPLEAAGAAYVFERNGNGAMELVHKIVYWNRAWGDQFGYSVSMNGGQMVIGAPFEKDDPRQESILISAGAAHVFFKQVDGRWYWTDLLVATDRAAGDNFGTSVCISGSMIVVGAPTADEMAGDIKLKDAGAAYTFKYYNTEENAGWRSFQKIVATDRAESDWFGYSVGIDNDNVIVGAPFQDKSETRLVVENAGAGYIFNKAPCITATSSITATACKTYTSPSKKYNWARSGSYKDTVLTKAGCDSIITINLTITGKADTSVTVKGNTLTAHARNASYQWINCATNEPINVTTRSLIVTVSGSYKVSIDQDGCVGVSSCHVVTIAKPDSSVKTQPPFVLPRNKANLKAFLETNKIVAQDRTNNDAFGTSVSISGNYAVIGAPTDDDDEKGGKALGAGSAYIFKLDDSGKWKQLQKISAFDRMPGAAFGCSVAISGNYLVVGANRDNLGVNGLYASHLAGSAYVFGLAKDGTWYFQQKIIANPTTRDGQNFFGTAVAIDGGTIVVSAPSDEKDTTDLPESNISGSGSLFVYQLTTQKITEGNTESSISVWVQTQKLVAKDRIIGNWLGNSVAICGDNIIAGSWGNDLDANFSISSRMEFAGAAYIFERRGGRFELAQKIVPEDRSPYDEFGFSVGISGDYAVVGARRVTEKGNEGLDDYTGNAYVFKRGADGKWVQQMKINPDDRTKGDYLGTAVGISGDYLIASAWGQDTDSLGNYMPDAGAIYVYYLDKKGDWILSDKVSPFYKHQLGHFGVAAAISDCNIIGSSSTDQTDENDNNAISGTGAAYIFTAAGCNNDGRCKRLLPSDKIPIDKTKNSGGNSNNLPKKYESTNLNGKGNDVPIDPINITNGDSTKLIRTPNPKTDTVKNRGTYDFSNVRICFDVVNPNVILPPRPETQFFYSVPEINPDGSLKNTGVIKQELAAYTDKMWSPGEILTVGFFNDAGATTFIIDKVKKYAKEWEKYANVKFEFVDNLSKAQIKVGFSDKNKSWSWLGRDLLINPFGIATMNFGWFTSKSTEKDFRVTIMHEFGHALGFVHEHQSPASEIKWDKEKLYAFFARPPDSWDKAKVDEQIINRYNRASINYSEYDPYSIMHYFFPVGLTTDGTAFSDIDFISGTDIQYAKILYPFPPSPKNTIGTLHTTDDCDQIDFSVEYNAVDTNIIEFVLEPGRDPKGKLVTWWKKIGVPLKGGVESELEIENGNVADKKFPADIIDNTRPISFWKAKFLGIHTLLDYKWNVLPAIIPGCRVKLTWKQDTCY